jgi:hypothetical protein
MSQTRNWPAAMLLQAQHTHDSSFCLRNTSELDIFYSSLHFSHIFELIVTHGKFVKILRMFDWSVHLYIDTCITGNDIFLTKSILASLTHSTMFWFLWSPAATCSNIWKIFILWTYYAICEIWDYDGFDFDSSSANTRWVELTVLEILFSKLNTFWFLLI